MSSFNEMDRNDYLKICNLIIELKEMAEKYDFNQLKYMDTKITIEKDKDAEKVVK